MQTDKCVTPNGLLHLGKHKMHLKYNLFENREHKFLSKLSPLRPQKLSGADKTDNEYFHVWYLYFLLFQFNIPKNTFICLNCPWTIKHGTLIFFCYHFKVMVPVVSFLHRLPSFQFSHT